MSTSLSLIQQYMEEYKKRSNILLNKYAHSNKGKGIKGNQIHVHLLLMIQDN